MRRTVACLLALACGLFPLAAQEPMLWTQRTDVGSPGLIEGAAMAFDEHQGVTLLFGGDKHLPGQALGLVSNELWQYNGTLWQQVTVTGPQPQPRSGHSMVYDPVDERVLMFGGDGGGVMLADLWAFEFSGPAAGSWVQLASLVCWNGSDFTRRDARLIDDLAGTTVTRGDLVGPKVEDRYLAVSDTHFSGTNTANPTITGTTAADAGNYTLRVTNLHNQTETQTIRLTPQTDGIGMVVQGAGLVLTWPAAGGFLETATSPQGPWLRVHGASPPYSVAMDEGARFFRVSYP